MKRIGIVGLAAALFASISAYAQPAPDPTDLDADGVPGVASPGDAFAQIPEVYAVNPGGRLLIDRSHGEAGDVSGFMGFLQSQGWVVQELLTGPITAASLQGYRVLMVPTRTGSSILPFSPAEVTVIEAFVSDGNGLWGFHEYDRSPNGINSLSGPFGVTFRQDFVSDPTNNEGQTFWPTIRLLAIHSLTQGVASYGYYAGCCLAANAHATVVGMGDDDAMSANCLSFPPTLAAYESSGRAVCSGDITPLTSVYYPSRLRAEEELLLQNIANWLLGEPTTATRGSSWGAVKALFR